MNSIKLLHNNLRSCLPIVLTSLLLFLYTTAPINAHSANNNRAIHVDLNAGGDIQKERNPLTRQPGDSPAYNLVQWGCAFEGSKKYLVAVDNSTNSLDMYAYDPTVTPSLSYKQTLTFRGTINDVAVYNQDDSHIYLAIATPNNIQIQLWNGTVQPSGSFIALGSFATTSTVNTLAWWVDATNPLYSAYIATADRQNKVNIYGLSQSTYTFNPINSAAVGSSPLTSLLWYVQTDVMNNITLLDLIGGSTNVANEYTININPTTKSIGAITPNPIPYPMGSLSTCNTFLAIGDLGATPGCAGVTLYDVDSATGSITNMESVISDPDINATNIYYLAKCCS